jgi:hypothetical protein
LSVDKAIAETKITPYFSLGAYHRDCALTSEYICAIGSDTPGTIDFGFRIELKNSWIDEIDLGWHHQSYADFGVPFNDHDETQIDMYGIKLTWFIESWSFKL